MMRSVFTSLLLLVFLIVVIGLFLPRQVVIERERIIDHPREIIFEVMQDFRHFQHWSPWFEHAPDAGFRIEGPASGVGSTLVWSDERGSGAGRLWIVGVSPGRVIDMQMELGDTATEMYFRIDPAPVPGNRVSWGMRVEFGVFDLVGRYTGVLLQRFVGRDYSEGLDRLARYLDQSPGRVPPLPADGAGAPELEPQT